MQFNGFEIVRQLPPFTFNIFAVSLLLSVAATLKIVDVGFLVLSIQKLKNLEIHRLVTGFLFFGPLSINYLIFCV